MLLYLIRHGATDWNKERRIMGTSAVPLNEEGRSAARTLAKALAREGISKIYSSPVARARETAEILASAWGAAIEYEPDLSESDFEDWVGKTYDELAGDRDFILYGKSPTRSRFSRHEDMHLLQRRALRAVERIRSESGKQDRVAAISHSDVIKPILAHLLCMELGAMHRLSIAYASATLVDLREETPVVRFVNFAPWRLL